MIHDRRLWGLSGGLNLPSSFFLSALLCFTLYLEKHFQWEYYTAFETILDAFQISTGIPMS